MVDVINDPHLYTFIPFDPPSIEQLEKRYKRWAARLSPEGDEIWLNWVMRLKNGAYIGDLQAGFKDDRVASVAYMLATLYQGKGYAHEGLNAVIELLFDKMDVHEIKAWVDTRNAASIMLLKRCGFIQVDYLVNADYFKGANSDEFVFCLKNAHADSQTKFLSNYM